MNRTSISDLKAKAKDQLLGNYGTASGSFALLFVLIYSIMSIIMSAFTLGFAKNDPATFTGGLTGTLISQLFGMVISALTVLFTVGYLQILRRISNNEETGVSDLFYVFKNHPDKIIIVSLIMTGIQFILLLPANFVSGNGIINADGTGIDGRRFFLWIVLYLVGFAISFVIDLMFAMSFFIYLDDPDVTVGEMLRSSVSMMKGNKFRYFYMILSFLGYWILVILSVGIAALWVVPYQTMTTVCFYNDLKEGNASAAAVFVDGPDVL